MTKKSAITQGMKNNIGVESPSITYDIEKGAIIKFAESIEDKNPIFNDDAAARRTRYGGIVAPAITPFGAECRLDGTAEAFNAAEKFATRFFVKE